MSSVELFLYRNFLYSDVKDIFKRTKYKKNVLEKSFAIELPGITFDLFYHIWEHCIY